MQILVVGMHRSGTSAVTRIVSLMGAFLGDENASIGANEENPKGFWERRDVIDINEALLSQTGASWDAPQNFDPAELSVAALAEFENAAALVLDDLNRRSTWVMKDPRLSLTLPVWQPLLQRPLVVLVYRNPLEVADSLFTRNDIDLSQAVALWEKYTIDALQAAKNLPIALVSYNRLLADPVQECSTLLHHLQILGANDLTAPDEKQLLEFVDSSLYRNRIEDAIGLAQVLNSSQLSLFESLENKFIPDPIPSLSLGASRLLNQRELLNLGAAPRYRRLEERIEALTQNYEQSKTQRKDLEAAYEQMKARREEADRAYEQTKMKVRDLEKAFRRSRSQVEELRVSYHRVKEKRETAEAAYQRHKEKVRSTETAYRKLKSEYEKLTGSS